MTNGLTANMCKHHFLTVPVCRVMPQPFAEAVVNSVRHELLCFACQLETVAEAALSKQTERLEKFLSEFYTKHVIMCLAWP